MSQGGYDFKLGVQEVGTLRWVYKSGTANTFTTQDGGKDKYCILSEIRRPHSTNINTNSIPALSEELPLLVSPLTLFPQGPSCYISWTLQLVPQHCKPLRFYRTRTQISNLHLARLFDVQEESNILPFCNALCYDAQMLIPLILWRPAVDMTVRRRRWAHKDIRLDYMY